MYSFRKTLHCSLGCLINLWLSRRVQYLPQDDPPFPCHLDAIMHNNIPRRPRQSANPNLRDITHLTLFINHYLKRRGRERFLEGGKVREEMSPAIFSIESFLIARRRRRRRTNGGKSPKDMHNGIREIVNGRVSVLEQRVWPVSSIYRATGRRATPVESRQYVGTREKKGSLFLRAAMTAMRVASSAFPS